MQQSSLEPSIIQSTTVKTIKELKKLGESRNQFENEEANESTVSGKGTPEEELCQTQGSNPKKISFVKPDSMRQITLTKQQSDQTATANHFKRSSMRFASSKLGKKQQAQQTDPVDIDNAMNLILQKSKAVKEQLDQMQFTQTQINRIFRGDKHFQFSFQSMLDKLVSQGRLAQNLTNIQKPVLMQIEQFAIAYARRCQTKMDLNQEIQEKQKTIDSMFAKYQKELNLFEQQNLNVF